MTINRISQVVTALSLVLFPVSILIYWVLYPAYGLLDSVAILRAIDGHAARTATADVFVFAGAFLAAPATLALMRVLNPHSPRLATIGGGGPTFCRLRLHRLGVAARLAAR